jgi:hypothetical protein
VLLVAVPALTLAAASPVPSAAQSGPWVTYPATSAQAQGADPYLLFVGDSLTVGDLYSVQGLAEYLTAETQRSTYVTATPGGQWITYGYRGQQNGSGLLWEYTDFLDPRLTVVALGTNDARIMTAVPERYAQHQHYEVMRNALRRAREHTRCVLLVNVREREVTGPGGMALADAVAVNDNIAWFAATDEERRTFVADWDSHAALQTDWFQPNDVHLTWAGQVSYASFIADQAEIMIRRRDC